MCGAVAGSVAKTIIAPAERVKMHFQISSDKFTARAALQRGLNMIKDEGVISLWYGHSTTLIRVAPYAGLQFAVHDHMEMVFTNYLNENNTIDNGSSSSSSGSNTINNNNINTDGSSSGRKLPTEFKFAAGAIGGVVATLVTYPLDVLRVRLALTPGATWRSTIQQGGLMRGLIPTLVGIIPYSGTAWAVKQSLHEYYEEYSGHKASLREAVLLNGLAGLAGQFVTYPLDVLRRRMQMANGERGVLSVFLELVKKEGTKGLWKGFTVNIFKGPVTISVSMTSYDALMRWIRPLESRGNE